MSHARSTPSHPPTLRAQATRAVLMFSLLAGAGATVLAASPQGQAALRADCDDPALARVISPQLGGEPTPAQAYWLDAQRLQWPGVQPSVASGPDAAGQFVVLASDNAQLQLKVGEKPGGVTQQWALALDVGPLPEPLAQRFKWIGAGARFKLTGAAQSSKAASRAQLLALHRAQMVLAQLDAQGRLLRWTRLQTPGALDDLFAAAEQAELGVTFKPSKPSRRGASAGVDSTTFALWAPTARAVHWCRYADAQGPSSAAQPMQLDANSGVWRHRLKGDLSGAYYRYLVDVVVPGVGVVRNRVTDPYAVSLNADSRRAYAARLDAPRYQPDGWAQHVPPRTVRQPTDMVVYELHVRDFSLYDPDVPAEQRGKYLAFTQAQSSGMKHLRALAQAGMTDVHFLPVFDIASIPERGCVNPRIPASGPASPDQQAAIVPVAAQDCFNWGYDPFHYTAPEGSYSSNADDGAARIVEFRRMVMALHSAGLRVGMDVVYNHTPASGQHTYSVLDRIVPGYYQRLSAQGEVERSTCCDNTATEHRMMGKLMIDSVETWVREYRIDSFRFDLMGHQPRSVMEALAKRADQAAGRPVQLLGEGWNFGEVANGARFVQASQLSLNGTGIGTFSDRGRDAARGGTPGDSSEAGLRRQGYTNGLFYEPNGVSEPVPKERLLQAADMIRVALAGSLRQFEFTDYTGARKALAQVPYGDQPAGYASQPSEVVNYTENHDNHTLFDSNVFKLPHQTTLEDRVRVQTLGAALPALSQGIAYFHAGQEVLRSKSLDRNSYDSGDWFNRLDLTYQDNGFGAGLPPKPDNGGQWAFYEKLLALPGVKPRPQDIVQAKDMFLDLLRIRASSSLFRMSEASEIQRRLRFHNTGPAQNPVLIVAELDGQGYPGAGFEGLMVLINVSPQAQSFGLTSEAAAPSPASRLSNVLVPQSTATVSPWRLHPVQASAQAADARVRAQAKFDAANGRFVIPARSAVVFVR